jgi:hypothetical protein
LINLGVKSELLSMIKSSSVPAKDRSTVISTKKDNTEKYKQIKDILDIEIKQLV